MPKKLKKIEFGKLNDKQWFTFEDTLFFVDSGCCGGKHYNATDAEGNGWIFHQDEKVEVLK